VERDLSYEIIGAAIEVHRLLGPGLLESVYEAALFHELELRGLKPKRQCPVKINYKGVDIKDPLYLDLIVNDEIVIEVKATEQNHPIYQSQVLTYLRVKGVKLGLIINFGYPQLKDGIIRIVNNFESQN